MKITSTQLRRIIKEEIAKAMGQEKEFELPFGFFVDVDEGGEYDEEKYDQMVLDEFGHLPIKIESLGPNYDNFEMEYRFIGTKDALRKAVRLYNPGLRHEEGMSDEKYISYYLRPASKGGWQKGTFIK